MKRSYLLLICLAMLDSSAINALPEDKKLPLHVVADKVSVDYAKGVTYLEGNVKVTQGTTNLLGDTVLIYTNSNQQLIKLISHGNQEKKAYYETLPSQNESVFHASADTITYMNLKKVAIFDGNAHATDGMNEFDGPEFEYFTDEQKVVTQKTPTQRSSIIIYPESEN